MKTIGIVGASGKAGRFLVYEGLKKGYKIKVLLRDVKNLKYFMHYLHTNVEVIEGDVHSIDNLRELLTGCDLVVNTLGQLKNSGGFYESTVKNILLVMEELNINKYVGICASSLNKDGDDKTFIHKMASKFMYKKFPEMMLDKINALTHLEKCNINWTLYRVPKVLEFSKVGEINFNHHRIDGFKINNKSLAKFILDNIEKDIYHNEAVFIWE